jgi:hypothetical protein
MVLTIMSHMLNIQKIYDSIFICHTFCSVSTYRWKKSKHKAGNDYKNSTIKVKFYDVTLKCGKYAPAALNPKEDNWYSFLL